MRFLPKHSFKYLLSFFISLVFIYFTLMLIAYRFASEEFMNQLAAVPLLPFLILFLAFVILPSIIATKFAFKEQDITENRKRIGLLVLTPFIIFGMIFAAFSLSEGLTIVEPYTYTEIPANEFSTLHTIGEDNQIIASQKIGDIEYRLVKSPNIEFYKYNQTTQKVESIAQNIPVYEPIESIWFDEKRNTLFVFSEIPQVTSSFSELYSFQFGKDGNFSKQLVYTMQNGFYSRSHILDYFPNQQKFLAKTAGGDGCGGGGELWLLDIPTGHSSTVQKFLSGCSNDGKAPEYVAYKEGLLYFAQYTKEAYPQERNLVKVYTINPITRDKGDVLLASDIKFPVMNIYSASEETPPGSLMIVDTANKSYWIDLKTKEVTPYSRQ